MASQMNDGLANWERDRRVTSCPDYEEKQLLALNGKSILFLILDFFSSSILRPSFLVNCTVNEIFIY
jgi:hypothetical protein